MGTNVKGVLGEKLGMTQVWDDQNRVVPVTVVKAGPCVVTQVRTPENDGYSAVQIAFGAIEPRKVTKPQAGHFAKAGVTPRRHVAEIRTEDATEYTLGQELGPDTFEVGQMVDVIGTTKGKGTWSDAVGLMEQRVPDRVNKEVVKALRRHLGKG
jgi:large subunit ribosomal protein L3